MKENSKGDILIVDDVPENLELLFNMLSEYNYEVRRVLSGKQALKIAEIDPPDLILLDILMPEIDGYEVCEKIKKSDKTKHIPVIFLSALNDPFDKVKAFQVGGVDYINKPFNLEEVLARIENQLALLRSQKKLEKKNQILLEKNQQLDRQKKELEIVNKELEAFNNRVSHDISNHLQSIQGFSEILLDDSQVQNSLDPESLEYMKIIKYAAKNIDQIIIDLKRLSHINSIKIELDYFDLSAMISEIFSNLKTQYSSRKTNLQIVPNIIVKGDINLLRIALENLINNAWKYSSKKDHTFIEFGTIKSPQLTYFIKDNGAGFDMNKAQEIFTPFKRLHSSQEFEGTGIGLSTVEKIINLHGGKIWYNAEIDQGATFYFTLN
jgi:two-component system sensor histidine kinase/response regulator